MSSEVKEVKLPLGIMEIFYEKWLEEAINQMKQWINGTSSNSREINQFLILYPVIVILVNVVLHVIAKMVQLLNYILSNELGILSMSLIIGTLIIETVRTERNIYSIYAAGKLPTIRGLIENQKPKPKPKETNQVDNPVRLIDDNFNNNESNSVSNVPTTNNDKDN